MAHHTSPSILVVDDETAICQSCSEVLEPEGYAVTVCNCGETGLQTYLEMIPDIAFIDIKMPGMSGMELLERIRDHDKNAVLIVITGFVSIESAVSSMKLGAFDFLPKPFTPNELRIIAARGTKHRRAVQEAMRLRLEKERMKETFVSMVSHQLKGPLAVVQQYFDVVLGEMIGTLNEDQKNTLSRCRVRIHELLHLIDSWLAYSRIDPSILQKEYADVDVIAMLHEIISFLDPTAKAQGVTITVQADRSAVIMAHRDFLREALTNLVSNGISYNHAGGTVAVVVTEDQSFVNIEVQDTGVGIDEESLPFIFEEFYRSNRTKLVVGSGLGLSIVKRIIDGHRGSISVRSAVGKGTTFKVTLPLQTGK